MDSDYVVDDVLVDQARVNAMLAEKIAAISAFHRWRHTQTLHKFKRQLEGLAHEIDETEAAQENQAQELIALKDSHAHTTSENERLRIDLQNTLNQIQSTKTCRR